ncbi:MAG: GNAT family N-acetyltransferase [Flavobacterium sp.]
MIKKLEWDSDFFGIEIGEYFHEEKIAESNFDEFELIYVKSEIYNSLEIKNFENTFSETKLIFAKELKQHNNTNENIFSFKQIKVDKSLIYELAFESGKFSRFNLDPNFQNGKFHELYKLWIDNSISNVFADDLLVYLEKDEIVGFITYKTQNDTATVGLVAVNQNYQGKGIGSQLLKAVEYNLINNSIKTLLIPTQQINEIACNFYKKQGYSINETLFIKHYWKK